VVAHDGRLSAARLQTGQQPTDLVELEHPAGALREEEQEVELQRGERKIHPTYGDSARGDVDR
jgi:hypothetical protein